MTIADNHLKWLCSRILYEGTLTEGEKVRPRYSDGTPSHTLFMNQMFERFDLSKGELPIVTLRPIA